jgi:hypothetical protein
VAVVIVVAAVTVRHVNPPAPLLTSPSIAIGPVKQP